MKMSPDEKAVIALITKRMKRGRHTYGRLVLRGDKRDLLLETLEELIDAAIYLACQVVKLRK